MTMQRDGSRLVSPHGSSKPSSMVLPGIQHLCSTTLTAQGPPTTSCPSEAAQAPQELPGFSPLHAVPIRADQVPARANRKTPYRTEGVHQ